MMGLSDGERISMICSAVLIQITRVTNRRTDRQTDGIGVAYTALGIASRGKNGVVLVRCGVVVGLDGCDIVVAYLFVPGSTNKID